MWTGAHFEVFTATALMLHSRKNVTLCTGGCGRWRFVNSQHYCAAGWHGWKNLQLLMFWWILSTYVVKRYRMQHCTDKGNRTGCCPQQSGGRGQSNEVVDSESINICSSAATVPNCRLTEKCCRWVMVRYIIETNEVCNLQGCQPSDKWQACVNAWWPRCSPYQTWRPSGEGSRLLAGLRSACLVRWSLQGHRHPCGYACVHCWAIWRARCGFF